MADVKKVKFVVRGEIELSDECSLEEATAHVKAVAEKARELSTATVETQMSIPRLVNLTV